MKCIKLIFIPLLLLILIALALADSRDNIFFNLITNVTNDSSLYVFNQSNPISNNTEFSSGNTIAFSWNVTIGRNANYGVYYIKSFTSGADPIPASSSTINITVWAKQGLIPISYTPGAPFYIMNGTNPISNNSEFGPSQTIAFSWNVNATGLLGNYTIFSYSNASSAANTNSTLIDVTIFFNTAPNVTIPILTPVPAYTIDSLSGNSTFTDAENDTGTLYWRWYVNSVLNYTGSQAVVNGTIVVATLGSGNTTKSQSWILEVWGFDGTENSTVLNSTALTISDAIPIIPSIYITSLDPKNYSNGSIIGWHNYNDIDSDAWIANSTKWYKNGLEQSLYNLSNLASGNLTKYDTWTYSASVKSTLWSLWTNSSIYINDAPPYANATIPNVAFNEDLFNNTIDADSYFRDADLDDFNYTFLVNESRINASWNNNTGVFLFTAQSNWFGSGLANLSAIDAAQNVSTSNNFVITVNAINDAPSSNGTIPSVTFTKNTYNNTIDLDSWFADVDNLDLNYTHLVNETNLNISINNITGVVLITATSDWIGVGLANFTAWDHLTNSVPSNNILISVTNLPPVNNATIPNVAFNEDLYNNTITLKNYFYDPETDPLTFDYSVANANVNISINNATGLMTITASSNWFGVANANATAFDPYSSTRSNNFNITVNSINDVPTHTIPILNTSNVENRTNVDMFCYNRSTYDADDDLVTNSRWWFRNNTLISSLTNLQQVSAGNTSKDDSWICQVRPNDGIVDGVSLNSTQLVILDTPPTIPIIWITSSDPNNYSNGTITGHHTYYDIDSDTWVFNSTRWYENSVEMPLLANLSSLFGGNTSKYDLWVYSASVGNSWSNWSNASIYINDAPPNNNASIPNVAFGEDLFNNTLDADNYFSDPDFDDFNYTFRLNESNINASWNNISGVFTFTATSNWFGSGLANITAWDAARNSSLSNNFLISVNAVNDAPYNNATIPNVAFNEELFNNTIDLDNYFADIDSLDLNFTHLVNATNLNFSINNITGIVLITATSNWFGTGLANFTAHDGSSGSGISNNMVIIVNNVNDAPTIEGLPDREAFNTSTINWGSIVGYTADLENNTLAFSISQENASQINCEVNSGGTSLTTRTNSSFYGTGSCTVQVDDGNGGTDTDVFDVLAWNKVGLVPTTATSGAPFYITDVTNPIVNNSEFGAPPHHRIYFDWTLNVSVSAGTYTLFSYSNASIGGANVNSTQINVTITLNPIPTLSKPAAGAGLYWKDRPFLFNFSVIGEPQFNCSLWINGTLNQTNTSVNYNEITNFQPINLNRADYSWYVDCYDPIMRHGTSATRILSVLNSNPYYSTIPNLGFDEDGFNNTIDLDNYFSDPDSDNVNWTSSASPSQINISLSNITGVVLITTNSNWNGVGYANFTGYDGYSGSNISNTITISVAPINDAPAQGIPIINTTDGMNSTLESIRVLNQSTQEVDNEAITNIYNWFENGKSLTVLNVPFDTNSSTSANDYSPYSNDGIVSGALWNYSGIDGGAYLFDGVNDYIKIQNHSTIVWNGSDMTWDIFFERRSTNNEVLFDKENATGFHNYRLEFVNNKLKFSFAFLGLFNLWDIISIGDFNNGTYHQTFYNSSIGGVQINQSFYSGNYTSKVFDSEVNDTQWNNMTFVLGAPYGQTLPDNQTIESDVGGMNMTNTLLLLHMDNNSGFGENSSFVHDFSEMGNDAQVFGAQWNTSGRLGSAYYFNGSGSLEIPEDNSLIASGKGITLSAWFRPTNSPPSTYAGIISKGKFESSQNDNSSYGIFWTTSGFEIFLHSDNQINYVYTISKALGLNQWHHVAVSWNMTGINVKNYVNGNFVSSLSNSKLSGPVDNSTGRNLTIGRGETVANAKSYYFKGLIDEVSIINRSLGDVEITNMYKRGLARLNISARSCDDGLCVGDVWNQTFNSSPQTLSLANNRYYQFRADLASDNESVSPELFNASVGYTKTVQSESLTSASNVADTNFHHATVTFESDSNNLSIFLDGLLDNSSITTYLPIHLGNDLFLGLNYPSMSAGFNGTIDSFRIWNRTLTSAQILRNFIENRTGNYKSLVADETILGYNYSACITVNDGTADGNTACSVNLTIISNPPVLSLKNITFAEDAWNYTFLSDWVADYDTNDTNLNWSFNYTASSNASITISNVTKLMNITGLANQTGWFGLTLKALDPEGSQDIDNLIVNMTPVNDPPSISGLPNQTVALGTSLYVGSLVSYSTDVDNATLAWTSFVVNSSVANCTLTSDGTNLTIKAGGNLATTNCIVQVNDGEYADNDTFTVLARSLNFTITFSSGISDLIFIPNSSNATQVQPVNQTNATGVFNLTNLESDLNITFSLRLNYLTPNLNIVNFSYFIFEDFSDLEDWNHTFANGIAYYNASIKWTKLCYDFQPYDALSNVGDYSGRFRYNFNYTNFILEYYNGSDAINYTGQSFNCSPPYQVTKYTNNYTRDWQGYGKLNYSYYGSNLSNDTLSLIVYDGLGSSATSNVVLNSSSWKNIEMDITSLLLSNITRLVLRTTQGNSLNNHSLDSSYIDEVLLWNGTITRYYDVFAGFSSNYSLAINLTDSSQTIGTVLSNSSQLMWLWMNFYNTVGQIAYELVYSISGI